MCGIITVVRKDGKSAVRQVLKSYEKQKTRGDEGFGFVAIGESGAIKQVKREESENSIRQDLKGTGDSVICFHHRYPTSTPNFAEVAHPIKVLHKDLKHNYYVMHNGIITDSEKLKEKHEQAGFIYTTTIRQEWITSGKTYFQSSFNDSEAFAIELAKTIDGGTDKVEAGGSVAFVCVQTTKGKTEKCTGIYYGRNEQNPLKVEEAKDFIRLASENGGKLCEVHKLYCLDLASRKITERACEIGERTKELDEAERKYWDGWDKLPGRRSRGVHDSEEEDFVFADEVNTEVEDLQIELQAMEENYQQAVSRGDYKELAEMEEAIDEVSDEIAEKKREVWQAS